MNSNSPIYLINKNSIKEKRTKRSIRKNNCKRNFANYKKKRSKDYKG